MNRNFKAVIINYWIADNSIEKFFAEYAVGAVVFVVFVAMVFSAVVIAFLAG